MTSFLTNIIETTKGPSGEDTTKLAIGISIVALVAVVYALRDEERLSVLKKDFTTPVFVGVFVLIIILATIGLSLKEGRAKNATRHAVIAFITAYLAHLNMAFAVFFIVGLFVYYTGQDIMS
jgi:uncharacterized membrane protein